MRRNNRDLYPYYMVLPAVIIMAVFFVLPVVASFFFAFTDWNISRIFDIEFVGLKNFLYIFNDEPFNVAIVNTFVFAVASTVLKTLIGLLLALALVRPLRMRSFLRTVFYMPAVLSMIVVGLVFISIFQMNGLLNQILEFLKFPVTDTIWLGSRKMAMGAIIFTDTWKWAGFNMAIFIAGLQGIDVTYYEAATIDGASKWTQFRNITFPLLMPALTTNFTLNVIGGLKVFDQVFIMTSGGPGYSTQVLSTYIYSEYAKGLLGRATAIGLILFLIVMAIALPSNHFLRKREVEV